MHTKQNAPILQLFPHKQTLPHPTTTREFIGDQIKKQKIQFQRDFIL